MANTVDLSGGAGALPKKAVVSQPQHVMAAAPASNSNEIKQLISQMRQEHSDSLESKLTEITKLRNDLKEALKENSKMKLLMANNPPSNAAGGLLHQRSSLQDNGGQ